ncbi:MAG: response regulator, partial [Nitrospinota bacterium]
VRSLKSEGGEVPKIVMLVTTNQLARQHTRMKNLDIAHHLIKPVDPDRLLETLFALSSGELPVQKSGAPAPEKGSFQNAGPDKPLIQILLADDNRDNQKIVGLFLKHQNYCLDVVDNGLQAVEAAREKKYDLILMDIAMPVMDGYNAVKNIRKIELARKTPVIALTARAFSDDKEKWEESGFDGHISKPLNLKSFRRLVEEALEKGESFCSGR